MPVLCTKVQSFGTHPLLYMHSIDGQQGEHVDCGLLILKVSGLRFSSGVCRADILRRIGIASSSTNSSVGRVWSQSKFLLGHQVQSRDPDPSDSTVWSEGDHFEGRLSVWHPSTWRELRVRYSVRWQTTLVNVTIPEKTGLPPKISLSLSTNAARPLGHAGWPTRKCARKQSFSDCSPTAQVVVAPPRGDAPAVDLRRHMGKAPDAPDIPSERRRGNQAYSTSQQCLRQIQYQDDDDDDEFTSLLNSLIGLVEQVTVFLNTVRRRHSDW